MAGKYEKRCPNCDPDEPGYWPGRHAACWGNIQLDEGILVRLNGQRGILEADLWCECLCREATSDDVGGAE